MSATRHSNKAGRNTERRRECVLCLLVLFAGFGCVSSAVSESPENATSAALSLDDINGIISDIQQMDLLVLRIHDYAHDYRNHVLKAQGKPYDEAHNDYLALIQDHLVDIVGRAKRIDKKIKRHAKAYYDSLDRDGVQCYNYHSQFAFAFAESLEEAREYLYSVINHESTEEWDRHGVKASCYADLCILYARAGRACEAVEFLFKGIMANLKEGAVAANYRLFWATKALNTSGVSKDQLKQRLTEFREDVPEKQLEDYDHTCWLVVDRIAGLIGTEEGRMFSIESEKEDFLLGDFDIPKSTDIWIGLLPKEVIEFRKRTIPDRSQKAKMKYFGEAIKQVFRKKEDK